MSMSLTNPNESGFLVSALMKLNPDDLALEAGGETRPESGPGSADAPRGRWGEAALAN